MSFPLRVSANRRYLECADGSPFFYHADTAWRAVQRLTLEELARYLDDRAARGFTAVHLHAINKEREGPLNRDRQYPFRDPDDVTVPNEAYWRHVDAVLEAVARRGLLAVVSAAWFGFDGVGWRASVTPGSARTYGRFLGERYNHLPNVLWVQGGDNDPGDRADAARVLAETIKERAPHHLNSYHAGPEHASGFFFHDAAWLDVNMAYTYRPAHLQVRVEHARQGAVRPIVLGETGYEGESNSGFAWTPRLVRHQSYWALLAGAAGHAFGHGTVWAMGRGWRDALDSPALRQMAHVRTLFAARAWHRLAPDPALVVAGHGDDESYVAAARAEDGSFALLYLPVHKPITIDLTRLRRPVAARWFDPTSGRYQRAAWAPLPNQGQRQLVPPTVNDAGDSDFVLALDPE